MSKNKVSWRRVYIDGDKTKYKVSSDGRIKNTETKKELSTNTIDRYWYCQICLSHKAKKYVRTLHTLVARAFIPNPENKPQVNHKDGNKLNNNVSNLEWATNQENIIHAYKTGLHDNVAIGSKHGMNKFSEDQIRKVCRLLEEAELSIKKISEKTKVPKATIHDIISGNYWTHISKEYDIESYRDKIHYKDFPKELHDKIKKLAKEGKSYIEIKEDLDLPYSVKLYSLISYYVKKQKKK